MINANVLWERCYNMTPDGWADYLTEFTSYNWYPVLNTMAVSETGEEYSGEEYRSTVSKYFDDLLYYAVDWGEEEFVAALVYQVLLETADLDLINRPESHKRVSFHA